MVVARHPLLQLARVSGRDAEGPDGRPLGALDNVSVTLEAGVHAFVGRPADGTAALCALIAGRRATSVGVITVLGREPRQSAATRRRMGVVLAKPFLPGGARATVADALASMGRLRGLDLSGCLGPVGAESLRGRRLASLDAGEARAVELAALLACPRLAVLVLFEPLGLGALREDVVRERLAAHAADGACVVLATATPQALGSLPDHVFLLEAGRLWGRDQEVGWASAPIDPKLSDAGVRAPLSSLVLWLREADARKLVAHLSARDEVVAVTWKLHDNDLAEVSISSHELEALALAVADEVDRSAVDIVALHELPTTLDGMRSAARAHRSAREARAPLHAPTPPPPPLPSDVAGAS